jgi:hypothetical protein
MQATGILALNRQTVPPKTPDICPPAVESERQLPDEAGPDHCLLYADVERRRDRHNCPPSRAGLGASNEPCAAAGWLLGCRRLDLRWRASPKRLILFALAEVTTPLSA